MNPKVKKAIDTKTALVSIEKLLVPLRDKLIKQIQTLTDEEAQEYMAIKKERGLPL